MTPATQGCSAGVMPQARKSAEDALEKILLGGDAQSSLSAATTGLKSQLDDYNSNVQ